MRILIVSAHPDDETLGMGGTILKAIDKEYEISWLLMTAPEDGDNFKKARNYIEKALEYYRFKDFHWLKEPTSKLSSVNLSPLIEKIRDILSEIRPEYIFTVSDTDIHTDHQYTFKAIIGAAKPFYKNSIKAILKYEVLSSTNIFPKKENSFTPNTFIDITKYIKQKEKAFKELFPKEYQQKPFPRNSETIRALARYRGSMCGFEYAEAFELVFWKWNV